MEFRYRYVNYGTIFRWHHDALRNPKREGPPAAPLPPVEGHKEPQNPPGVCRGEGDFSKPEVLYDNELVVDVGGVAWGHNTDLPVLDHHFAWDEQYPCASAAVLHNAERVYKHFHQPADAKSGTVWLVSHNEPDFDAYCSMYLARRVIEGAIPHAGWEKYRLTPGRWGYQVEVRQGREERVRVDWYRPFVPEPADDDRKARRWAMLLAAYAALVDQCKRIGCPKDRALHSVLYAANARGRNYRGNGAVPFFKDVERQLASHGLNPLCDSVLETVAEFEPERRLLDWQPAAYLRDLARARKSVVFLRRAGRPFEEWFREVEDAKTMATPPFRVAPGGPVHPIHREELPDEPDPKDPQLQTDGIYIRDPECLIFKEWARQDLANSSLGRGFLFTAIASTGGRSGNSTNATEYYFSIDPERAEGAHLYDVWSRLQEEEMRKALPEEPPAADPQPDGSDAPAKAIQPRPEFVARGRDEPGYFHDPWFDGQSYACTIIPTPNRGTFIGKAGTRADLTDDPVVGIVREVIEHRASYRSPEEVVAFDGGAPLTAGSPRFQVMDVSPTEHTAPAADAVPIGDYQELDEGRFRLVTALLNPAVDLTRGDTARVIGATLWPHLGAAGTLEDRPGRPAPLAVTRDWVAVWTDRGVAVTVKATQHAAAPELAELFHRMVRMSARLNRLVRHTAALARWREAEAAVARTSRTWWRVFASADRTRQLDAERAAAQAEHDEAEAARNDRLAERVAAEDCPMDAGHDEGELVRAGQVLLADVANLRHALTTPVGAPLRGFFEASGIEGVLGGWVQTHQASVVGENVRTIADVQSKLKWVELFLITVYALELIHVFTVTIPLRHDYAFWWLIAAAAVIPPIAFLILRPHLHALQSVRLLFAIVVYAALLALFVGLGKAWYSDEKHKATGPPVPQPIPHATG